MFYWTVMIILRSYLLSCIFSFPKVFCDHIFVRTSITQLSLTIYLNYLILLLRVARLLTIRSCLTKLNSIAWFSLSSLTIERLLETVTRILACRHLILFCWKYSYWPSGTDYLFLLTIHIAVQHVMFCRIYHWPYSTVWTVWGIQNSWYNLFYFLN